MLNIIDIISNSDFLNKLFPSGLDKIAIHKIDYINLEYGNSTLYIYTNQKPNIEIKKYGIFGKDYDTLVIEILCEIIKLDIKNAHLNKNPSMVDIHHNEKSEYELKQNFDNGYIHIVISREGIFQKISAYIESK